MAAGPLTAIATVKEYEETYLPLFLWEFTFSDGSWAGFATHGLVPAEGGFTYQGRNYQGLVLNGDVAAAQAMSSNGVTMYPSLQLELDDADRVLTTNVEIEGPGFKGAQVVLRFLFYDPTATSAASAFSTDDIPLFLGSCISSPEINDATIRLTVQSLLHLAQGTLPCIHIQKRCPWIHPNTPEEKAEANKYESWFYNCGDTSTAAGHDHCDYTVSDCKRLGMWDPVTGKFRFGGIEAEPPPTWTGRPFGGDNETRDNAKNHTLDSEYVPHLYGRGWIEPIVLNVSGEANYTRMQLLVCYGQTMAAIGLSKYSNSWKLAINDSVTQENSSSGIFQPGVNGFWSFVSSGARDGALCNQVGYQVSDGHGGLTGGGDPFGSMTVLYASVLRRVTESNQVPSVQLLADGGMIPVFNSDDPADFTLKQTKNPVWQAIDMLMWGGRSYSDMRLSTFRAIAALADEQITASDRNGVAGTRARFESCIVARHPRSIGDLLQGVLGSFGGYLTTTDKIELHMYQTLCSEQPSPISGSNDNTGYSATGALGGFNGQTTKGNPGTGYVAYSFDSSNIKEVNGHTTLRRLPVSMGDEPNTFSYTFQDSQNDYQLDTLTVPDVDAINRNSGQQIVATAPFEGITTYDQAFRMGRRSLARRLRGNPTGDPRGTWRMAFTASVKAVSLRLGHLVLLTAEEYGLDKQLFRIEVIKPALNFQEADLVLSWHEDALLMDDYGISGFPPISGSRQESNRNPRTWQPYDLPISATNPLYHGDPAYTFAMRQWLRDGEALTDSMVRIQGYPPITLTAAMDIQPPWFTDQDLVAQAGGTLAPDNLYYVCMSVDDGRGKLSSPSTIRRIHLPVGMGQFLVQNLFWRGGGQTYVFVGRSPDQLSWCKTVSGQPGAILIGDLPVPKSSWGPPDSKAHHFIVRWRESIHAGVYGGAVAQVLPGGTSLKIAGAAFAVNEWANRIMSVIGDANAPSTGDYFRVIDCVIASNTADTLVLSGSGDLGALGVQAGDAIVIRTVANIVSATTIGDTKFINSAAPTGMGEEVIGREVVILWGAGAGQHKTIIAHDGTLVTVSQAWEYLPDATSVFVIEEIGWESQETAVIQADGSATSPLTITDIAVQNWAARTIRVEVNISDSVGKLAIEKLSREIYLYASFDPADIGGGGVAAPAPNILSASVLTRYSCPNNDSEYDFQFTINLPMTDPNIGHLKKIRIRNSLTGTDVLVLGQPATGWTSPLTVATDLFLQTRALQSGTATFNCENEDGVVTSTPVVIPISVQASAVTGFTFAGEVGARFIALQDNPTRLVSCTIGFKVTLNGNQVPQSIYYLRSLNDGATWTGIGFQAMKTVGEQLTVQSLAPGVDQTWKIAACTGALAAISTPITAANIATLFSGIQISAGFLVEALELPASLISDLTVSPGDGSTYPYDTVRTDGSRYWKIPSVTVADNPAVPDPNAFFLRVTVQDLDVSHNTVAPEHPFAGDQVSPKGQTNVYGPLMGDYGTNGLTIVRTGNIAYVRFRLYLCNRVDQTEFSFQNPKCATLQMGVGEGLGYLDVAVSTDGSIPLSTDPLLQPAPPVDIAPNAAKVIFRSDHRVEVNVDWTPHATATPQNFSGVAVYLEDPDISSGENVALGDVATGNDGIPLDRSVQVSGRWAPVIVNESAESPAVLFVDSTMGASSGQTYKASRTVRVYLASFGPHAHQHLVRDSALVRATGTDPTPNILVPIPIGRGSGESGQEWAFLVSNVSVAVTTDYDRAVPRYSLTLKYTPPDQSVPVPPGMNHFGGCRIVFVYEDALGAPIFPGSDTGMDIPVAQADTGFKSDAYEPSPAGGKFRVYFVSEDDAQPLGSHVNTLIEGGTPFAYAIIPPVPATPNVTNFAISGKRTVWYQDGSMVAHADFTWNLTADIRYAGVFLYLVKVTGGGSTPTKFPQDLTGPQSNVATGYPMEIPNVPKVSETWTIAAISYDTHGTLKEKPTDFGKPGFTSPIVTWDVGPPTPGSPNSGIEYAPLVTVNAGATVTPTQTMSADGVGMVSFNVGAWTNPTDNQFGSAQVAMVINRDPTKPTFWSVPVNNTSFQTPAIPSFGNIGSPVNVDFYIVSDDPQGHKNSLQATVTPKISYNYTPTAGAIIPSRTGWFDDTQFSWITDPQGSGKQVMHADNITADNVYISRVLVVGGDPNPTFKGMSNGQIAVKNSSQVLRAWIGEQQADQGKQGAALYGGWFAQLWVGGTSPLDAPLWVDPQGIIQVGGIAAGKGAVYPYLSIRDQTGLEMGRIGASINKQTGLSGDNAGTNPPAALTAGAWFTQLAIGGNNLSNWNILITPDTNRPLGSLFQMRNIYMLTVDYASQQVTQPYNAQYRLEFGSSAWTTTGGSQWQFPGIRIYQVDPYGGTNFGAVYLSRGMVLKGTHDQGYPVLVSLVTFNGASSGIDSPTNFWGELAMYSDRSTARTVYLTSSSNNTGNAAMALRDLNNNLLFGTDTAGNTFVAGVLQGAPVGGATTAVTGYAYAISGYGQVIDATGAWKGKPIAVASNQTPWIQHIDGGGWFLTNTGKISSAQFTMNNGTVVIDTSAQYVGSGVNVHGGGIACGAISTFGGSAPNTANGIDTQTINCNGNMNCNAANSNTGYTGGSFRGAGVSVGSYGIGCGALSTLGGAPATQWGIDTSTINAQGNINCPNGTITGRLGSFTGAGITCGSQGISCGSLQVSNGPITCYSCTAAGPMNMNTLQINGTQRIDSNGIYKGGLQFNDNVYGYQFGIYGYSRGWYGGFYDRDQGYHVVNGGILINNPPNLTSAESTAVVCDRCGSWQIAYRRKTPLPFRQIKLSDALLESAGPRIDPGVPQDTEMIAECEECHFTVEYSSLMIN